MSLIDQTKLLSSLLGTPQQVTSTSWSDRKVILDDHINLFCWNRKSEPTIEQYLGEMLEIEPKPICLDVKTGQLSGQLKKARTAWEDVKSAEGDDFWVDVEQLVEDFLKLSNSKTATVHIRVVTNNACTKFHTDGYSLRLFSTYLGRGTEWLPEMATDRTALGKTNELIVKDHSKIQQMDSFEVGILKGESSDQPRNVKGIVHRSPEITTLKEKRIILRVDL